MNITDLIRSNLWLREQFTDGHAYADLLYTASADGSLVTSEIELSKRWKWSRGKVRRYLQSLQNDGLITQEKRASATLLYIKNFSDCFKNGTTTKLANLLEGKYLQKVVIENGTTTITLVDNLADLGENSPYDGTTTKVVGDTTTKLANPLDANELSEGVKKNGTTPFTENGTTTKSIVDERTKNGTTTKLANPLSSNELEEEAEKNGTTTTKIVAPRARKSPIYNTIVYSIYSKYIDTKDNNSIYTEQQKTDYLAFLTWLHKNAFNVLKMQEPFTLEQFEEVRKLDKKRFTDTITAMHNYKPLVKNNVSAYLTLLNWIRRDEEKSQNSTIGRNGVQSTTQKTAAVIEAQRALDAKAAKYQEAV